MPDESMKTVASVRMSVRSRGRSEAEAIQVAIEGPDVHTTVGHREAGEVIEGRDLIAAGPELFPRARIQGVQHSRRRMRDAIRRAVVGETDVGGRLRGVFA